MKSVWLYDDDELESLLSFFNLKSDFFCLYPLQHGERARVGEEMITGSEDNNKTIVTTASS